MGAMYGMVQQQAALLSFVEAFWVMGVIFLCMFRWCCCVGIRAICIRTSQSPARNRKPGSPKQLRRNPSLQAHFTSIGQVPHSLP
jgi:hypothetical protein